MFKKAWYNRRKSTKEGAFDHKCRRFSGVFLAFSKTALKGLLIMSERTGYNSVRTKNRNRGIVLRLVAGKQLSRADITKKIGLTKMAITKIVSELIEDGYIVEKKGENAPGVGRVPAFLEISSQSPVSLGLYISRNELKVIVCSFSLDRLFSESVPLKNESKNSLEKKIFNLCEKALRFTADAFPERKLLGIGVSSVGPLDPSVGIILEPTNFYGITDYPVAELLSKRYRLPVYLENDMNAAAIVEHFYGIGKVTDSFMYMGITNGIGAGIILDGHPCKLGSKSVGEIGHMSIQCEGPVCSCGNRGCLEVYANIPVITERLEKALGHPVLPKDFFRYAEIPAAKAVFTDVTEKLAVALVNTVNMLDLQSIVIGHEGIYLPDNVLSMLESLLNSRILSKGHKTVSVLRSSFGADAPLLGASCLIFDRIFTGEQTV